jgi:hypothetical protein
MKIQPEPSSTQVCSGRETDGFDSHVWGFLERQTTSCYVYVFMQRMWLSVFEYWKTEHCRIPFRKNPATTISITSGGQIGSDGFICTFAFASGNHYGVITNCFQCCVGFVDLCCKRRTTKQDTLYIRLFRFRFHMPLFFVPFADGK